MKRAHRLLWIGLLSSVFTPSAHADNLLIGTGGSAGTSTADNGVYDFDGAAGGINGGTGGRGYSLEGAGGGNIAGPVENPAASTVTNASLGSTVYDNVVVGGGGGGGSGTTNGTPGDGAGGTGGQGVLTISGSGLTINQTLYVGGFGGGAGGGEVSTYGGNGGAGGNGVVTLTGGGTTTANAVIVGGSSGSGGASGFSGALGGGGAGTLNLGGGSTLSAGSLLINGNGTLNIGNDTANNATAGTLAGPGSITDNGVINFNQSDAAYAFGADISGGGQIVQNGSGITILTGNNGYSGGTTVNAGLINFSSGGNLGTGNVTLNGGGLQWAAGSATDISSRLNPLGTNGGTFDTNGGTFDTNGNDVTLASGIGGLGGLTKTGAGTLTLGGGNTYSGATTISMGTLALSGAGSIALSSSVVANGTLDISQTTAGASITSLSGSGAVNLGSRTLTFTNAGGTFSGAVSGDGGLALTGGAQTLAGANTYRGATAIGAGTTLALLGTGSIAQSSGVVDNGVFEIAGTANGASIAGLSGNGGVNLGAQTLTLTNASGAFDGAIQGTGGLTVAGGTQTLTGASTYTGTTAIGSGATLRLSGAGSIAQSSGVADNGVFDISAATNGASIANLSGNGSVNLGSRTLTLADANGRFEGAFAGTGRLVKQGSGAFVLTGDSSAFAGTTEVTGGRLAVGEFDSPQAVLGGDVTVDAGGMLSGHGTIVGNVANGGILMPGGSIGTLTVGGNYVQSADATLSVEVSPAAASALKVNGSAALNGALAISYDPGTYAARSYTLVSAAKGVSGAFSRVDSTGASSLGSLTTATVYGANDVQLLLSGVSGDSDPVVIAPTGTSIYTALGTSAMLGAQAQNAALLNRLGKLGQEGASAPFGWITLTGNRTWVGGTNGSPAFQSNRYGFLSGLEKQYGGYTAGMAFGYDHTGIAESVTGDSGTIDTLRAALYGARALGPVNVGGTLGAGLDFLSQKRPFGVTGTAEGNHMGQEFNAGGQASLPLTFGSVTLTPRIGMQYAYFHANAFGESGAGGQNLNVGTDNVHSLQPYVGVTLDKAFGDASNPVNAQLRFGYAHELLDANRVVNVASQDGTRFLAPGVNLPRGYLTAGLGVTLHPRKNVSISLNYDALINTGHASAQQGSLRVSYQF